MANNRLYIGNTKTKEYILFGKSMGNGWYCFHDNPERILDFIEDDWDGQELGAKTPLVFFTEYDELCDFFDKEGTKIE